jgi:glucose dehydrogenase
MTQVASGGTAGAVVVVGIWLLNQWYPTIVVSPQVASAMTVILSTLMAAITGGVKLLKPSQSISSSIKSSKDESSKPPASES